MEKRKPVRLWLICGILACMLLGVPTWSRYRKNIESEGSAVIARLAVGSDINIEAGSLPKRPGESTETTFTVTNEKNGAVSEVKLQYHMKLETANNLPLTFALVHDETQGAADQNWIAAGSIAGNTTIGPGAFFPGEKAAHRYILTIGWPESAEADDVDYADEIDYVRLKIHAEQEGPVS